MHLRLNGWWHAALTAERVATGSRVQSGLSGTHTVPEHDIHVPVRAAGKSLRWTRSPCGPVPYTLCLSSRPPPHGPAYLRGRACAQSPHSVQRTLCVTSIQ